MGMVIEARHLCMMMRRVEKRHSSAVTSAMVESSTGKTRAPSFLGPVASTEQPIGLDKLEKPYGKSRPLGSSGRYRLRQIVQIGGGSPRIYAGEGALQRSVKEP